MAPQSSTFVWRIPWTEKPGGLQSMGSLRVGHDWVTSLSLFTFMHWRRKWQPTPLGSFLENPRDRGAWWAAVHGVAQSRTRLKQLSSSSNHYIYYCGQEFWRRSGVAIVVNKRVWNAVLGCNLKNIQATPAAQFQKNKQPNKKKGQRTKQTFLQRRHTSFFGRIYILPKDDG